MKFLSISVKVASLLIVLALIGMRPLQTPLERLLTRLGQVSEEYPQEKVYLHTDREIYAVGDDLWFKSYAVIGPYHQLDAYSNNLYVELIGPDNNLIARKTTRMDQGISSGDFQLPGDLGSGVYHLRAYTNWMRNFDEEFLFTKPIEIVSSNELNVAETKQNTGPIDLQFFPEGGDLVAGLHSNLAFKAVGNDGFGTSIEGAIFDKADKEITRFESTHLGMGVIPFSPSREGGYYAILDGTDVRYPLPKVQPTGHTLTVNSLASEEIIKINIRATGNSVDMDNLFVIVHSSGEAYFSALFSMPQKAAVLRIPKKDLPTGILHTTLFNKEGRPLAERLSFHSNDDLLDIKLQTNKTIFKSREKAEVEVEVKDASGNPVEGSFSISVTDRTQVTTSRLNQHIVSNLLLTSDLRGRIEEPNQYFNPSNAQRKKQLDLLLMTQGWRRFNWNNIWENQQLAINYPREQSINVQGRLTTKRKSKPVANGQVQFFNLSAVPPMDQLVETDEFGNFTLQDLIFTDSSKVMLRGSTLRGKSNVDFEFQEKEYMPLTTDFRELSPNLVKQEIKQDFSSRAAQREQIDKAYNFDPDVIQLEGVTVYANQSLSESTRARQFGKGDVSFDMSQVENTIPGGNALEVLAGRIPGVSIALNSGELGDSISVSIRGAGSILGDNFPLFLLDDVPVDIMTISSIPASDIEQVEVFKGASSAIYGARGGDGVLAFYSKKSARRSTPNFSKRKGISSIGNFGYSTPRQFYAPKYDVAKPEDVKPDYRALIHWEPHLVTNAEGKATFSFYTADLPTTLRIALEGISGKGVPGIKESVISVENR